MAIEPTILAPGMPDFYSGTQWERKAHGYIFINGEEVASTFQCPHCDKHFISRRGSGHTRTVCTNCMQVTCGSEFCVNHCVPWEKRMEEIERRATQSMRGL